MGHLTPTPDPDACGVITIEAATLSRLVRMAENAHPGTEGDPAVVRAKALLDDYYADLRQRAADTTDHLARIAECRQALATTDGTDPIKAA